MKKNNYLRSIVVLIIVLLLTTDIMISKIIRKTKYEFIFSNESCINCLEKDLIFSKLINELVVSDCSIIIYIDKNNFQYFKKMFNNEKIELKNNKNKGNKDIFKYSIWDKSKKKMKLIFEIDLFNEFNIVQNICKYNIRSEILFDNSLNLSNISNYQQFLNNFNINLYYNLKNTFKCNSLLDYVKINNKEYYLLEKDSIIRADNFIQDLVKPNEFIKIDFAYIIELTENQFNNARIINTLVEKPNNYFYKFLMNDTTLSILSLPLFEKYIENSNFKPIHYLNNKNEFTLEPNTIFKFKPLLEKIHTYHIFSDIIYSTNNNKFFYLYNNNEYNNFNKILSKSNLFDLKIIDIFSNDQLLVFIYYENNKYSVNISTKDKILINKPITCFGEVSLKILNIESSGDYLYVYILDTNKGIVDIVKFDY